MTASRMAVGRFVNRADALAFLLTKFGPATTAGAPAQRVPRYEVHEDEGSARVLFQYLRVEGRARGVMTVVGMGADVSAAVADLFAQLGCEADLADATTTEE